MTPLVEIYSTSTCHFCREAKEFFVEKKIEFVEYDVANDAATSAYNDHKTHGELCALHVKPQKL